MIGYQDKRIVASLLLLVIQVHSQGTRCQTRADCTGKTSQLYAYDNDLLWKIDTIFLCKYLTDKWNPYCSKWGYCISYDAHGSDGPGQSRGAVEDGKRGQCRSNADCTPHAPNCSPEGYCSQGLFLDIKSNAVKNDEYYGKIEDENREGHVESRKDDPLFQQRPDLLADVQAVENTVYQPCTYCNYEPDDISAGSQVPSVEQNVAPQSSNAAVYKGNKPEQSFQETKSFEQPILSQPSIISNNIDEENVFGIGSGSLQDQQNVDLLTPDNSIQRQSPQFQSVPQNIPINAYDAVPTIPQKPATVSQPISSPQEPSQATVAVSQEQPINTYDAIPAAPSVYDPVSTPQSQPQIPTLPLKPISPPTQPIATYNNIPSIATVPTLNTVSQVSKQNELPSEEKEIVPQTTYSVQTPINAFNPFQSPQYQTGQATSIHQQLPQHTGNFYNPGPYPFYQYPSYSINPYRYFFG